MDTGTVKNVSEKGFGFIQKADKRDVFFHCSGMVDRNAFDQIKAGDKVEFEIDNTGERPRAIKVQVVNS